MTNSDIVYLFFVYPWVFWAIVFSSYTIPVLIGFTFIVVVIIVLLVTLKWMYSIPSILLFLLWVGPVLLFLPISLMFAVGNVSKGDFNIPIGCGRREDGSLACM